MGSEELLICLVLYLMACAGAAQLFSIAKLSPVLAYITVGALLGPPLAKFVPAENGLVLAGLLGVSLSVTDTGLSTRLSQIRACLVRAVLVAVLGVAFPIFGACIIIVGRDLIRNEFLASQSWKTSFAVGAAIAPTSLGVTAALLANVGELESKLGTLISVAAVFDDVISLVLLSEITVIAGNNASTWSILQPVVFATVFIFGAVLVAVVLPPLFDAVFHILRLPERTCGKIGLWALSIIAIGMMCAAIKARTSFLLAAYLTGVTFASVRNDMARDPWRAYVGPYIEWLFILFFAATIGFVIPLDALFTPDALGLGALLAVVSVIGKLLCGLGMLPYGIDGLAVAVAMLGRGEFGFLIATQAREVGLLSERVYAATTWGVIVPTLIAPIIFGPMFRFRKRRLEVCCTAREHSLIDVSTTMSSKSDDHQDGHISSDSGSQNHLAT